MISTWTSYVFLLFINDLPLYLHHSSTDMYADDVVLEWCYINKMNLNAQQTKCMLVGSWKCKLCLPVFVRWTCVVLYICMNTCCIVHMSGCPQGGKDL